MSNQYPTWINQKRQTHSTLSPSKRERWSLCPASVKEEAKHKETKSGEAAVDGTHTHTLVDYCITNSMQDPLELVGLEMQDNEGSFVIQKDRAERAKVAVDYVLERHRELFYPSIYTEKLVDPLWLTQRGSMFGTCDCIIKTGQYVEIIDYKDGRIPVTAQGNKQLEQYAIGFIAEEARSLGIVRRWEGEDKNNLVTTDLLSSNKFPYKDIQLTIIQPRNELAQISTLKLTLEELLKKVPRITEEALATEEVHPKYNPGAEQCRWCKARGSCLALADNVVTKLFQHQLVPTEKLGVPNNPATLSNTDIADIISALPLIRIFLDGVETEALTRINKGQSIQGVKVGKARTYREWSIESDEVKKKLVAMGVPVFHAIEAISPAKAEKLSWKGLDGEEHKLSPAQKQTLSTFMMQREGSPKVVIDKSAIDKSDVSGLFNQQTVTQ